MIMGEEEVLPSAPKAAAEVSMSPQTTLHLAPIHWVTEKPKDKS